MLEALERYSKGKADFGDYMILAEGKKNQSLQFITFDQAVLDEVDHASSPATYKI